jgi:tripartite-type tricarboxylate transporter receptor subunit TctC
MHILRRRLVAASCIAALPGVRAEPAPYPAKPVTMLVPFPAGGTTDSIARIVGDKLAARLGQTFIVDNKPGAGGNIGAAQLARAEPDGYTLLASPPGPLTINFNLYKGLNYDARKFVPVSMIANMPNILVVGPSVKAKTLQELIDYARANPGKLSFASQGNGSTSHLTGILFQTLTGTRMVHVPYKGSSPALNDLIAGTVDLMFDNVTTTLPFHNARRATILAVATRERIPSIPEVPTAAEAGLANFESGTWVTLVAPAHTPAAIADKLAREIDEIIRQPDVIRQFAGFGAEPVGGTPAVTARLLQNESARWKKVIESAHITLE